MWEGRGKLKNREKIVIKGIFKRLRIKLIRKASGHKSVPKIKHVIKETRRISLLFAVNIHIYLLLISCLFRS